MTTKLTKKITKAQREKRIQVLEKALQLIGGRDGAQRWCQQVMARDKKGVAVDEDSKRAVRWCAAGALSKFGFHGTNVWGAINAELIKKGSTLATLNDTEGRGAVLRVLRSYKRKLERARDE